MKRDLNRTFTAVFDLGMGLLKAQRELLTGLAGTMAAGPAETGPERESMVALRAHEISDSPEAGSDFDNWIRAEQEILSR